MPKPIKPFNSVYVGYLVALYLLGMRYYDGQFSRGYRVLCDAKRDGEKHGYNIPDIAEAIDRKTVYPHNCHLIKSTAYWMRRMKPWRKAMSER